MTTGTLYIRVGWNPEGSPDAEKARPTMSLLSPKKDSVPDAPQLTPHTAGAGGGHRRVAAGLLEPRMLLSCLPEALRKLHPAVMVKNPVLFVVEVGGVLTVLSAVMKPSVFAWVISL